MLCKSKEMGNGESTIINVGFHLLFYCTKATIVWDIISRICGIDVSLGNVILSDQESDIAMLVIIVAYSICKEWLLSGKLITSLSR